MALACPSCAAEHPLEARFCSECGTPLHRTCPRCGAESGAAAAFCSACGMSLREGARPPEVGGEQQERRVVTILFADLAGSTALAASLDPEDVRELQAELFALIGAEVERFGGVTEKFVGDAVLAVFGIPHVHEDDAERAVRAALAVHERFDPFAAAVAQKHGAEVGLRIAVNTGEVVSSREAAARGDLVVSGEPVNAAARLQQHARPGETLAGERTHSVTRRAVSYGPPRKIDAKGVPEPIRAWPVTGLTGKDTPVGVAGFAAPLIGRDPELALLTAVAADRAERERTPQLITFYGQAGVGKSRLVSELLNRLEPVHVLEGRCLPYSHGSLYWPLAEALKAKSGILDTDSTEVALAKLRAAVDPLVGPAEAERAGEALAWTIGLLLPDSALAAPDPHELVRRLQDAWTRYLAALGRDGLAAVVLEDLQWASSSLLDLVDHLAGTLGDARLLIVCTARPELLETRPTWGAGKPNATTLTIPALSGGDAGRLARSLLGGADVPEGLSERVLGTAEGNPFFVEEMLRMLIEEGALERRGERWIATELLAEVSIPDSVHGVVAARIDLLEPPAREALRRCSVVGRAFWPEAVGVDEAVVDSLERRGLVLRRPDSVMEGMNEFAFKHAVTRDVAYSTLPRSERAGLHGRTADWIQAVAPDRGLELAELTAYHYCEAIASGEQDGAVVKQAFELSMIAAQGAHGRGAFAAAEPHLRRALELATSDTERAAVMLGLGRLDVMAASFERALAELDEAERLAGPDAAFRSDVLGWRSRACWLQGLWLEALESATAAVDALAGLPESPQLARALARRSQIEMLKSRPEAARHALEAIAVAQRVGEPAAEVNARVNLFTSEAMKGVPPDPDGVLATVAAALAAGTPDEAYRAIVNFIWSAAGYHRVSQIEQTVVDAKRLAEGIPAPETLGPYLDMSLASMLYVPSGRWDDADRCLAAHPEPPVVNATNRLVWLGLVAGLALRRGDVAAAERLLDELRPAAMASGEPQRIIPMAAVALPWAAVMGERDLLRSWTSDILDTIAVSAVLHSLQAVRAVAAAGETELLARLLEPLRAAGSAGSSNLATALEAAEGLFALAVGRPDDAVRQLELAASRQLALENVYHAACLDLDLARAYEAAGDEAGAASALARATSVLEPLGCVNAY